MLFLFVLTSCASNVFLNAYHDLQLVVGLQVDQVVQHQVGEQLLEVGLPRNIPCTIKLRPKYLFLLRPIHCVDILRSDRILSCHRRVHSLRTVRLLGVRFKLSVAHPLRGDHLRALFEAAAEARHCTASAKLAQGRLPVRHCAKRHQDGRMMCLRRRAVCFLYAQALGSCDWR